MLAKEFFSELAGTKPLASVAMTIHYMLQFQLQIACNEGLNLLRVFTLSLQSKAHSG